jgi:hypothetical protein
VLFFIEKGCETAFFDEVQLSVAKFSSPLGGLLARALVS